MTKKAAEQEVSDDGLIVVHSPDDIPLGMSEAEEAEFWATHTWSEEMMDKATFDPKLPPPRTRTRATSIRFDDTTVRRLKALAKRRGVAYQTLLKSFVLERLYEEEKREGII